MSKDIYEYDPEAGKQFRRDAAREFWKRAYDPRTKGQAYRNRDGYNLRYGEFAEASAMDHLKRGAIFSTMGSGAKRTDTMNALGFLTKAQKDSVFKRDADGNKMYTSNVGPHGPMQVKAKINKMNYVTNSIVPAATIAGIGMTLADGGGMGDFMADFVAPEIAGQVGWRLGANVGFAAAASVGASTATKAAVGFAVGATGFVAAGAAAMGAGDLILSSADSDNIIKTLAEEKRKTDFRSSVTTSSDQLTHRRKAMQKLSRSNLNDRGQLMGNEAMIMRGMM